MKKLRKWFKPLRHPYWLLCFLLYTATSLAAPGDNEGGLIEKKKTLSFRYGLNPADKISVENQFGDVRMKIWEKAEVSVQVTVTSNAPTEAKAAEFLSLVEIKNDKSNGQVQFRTVLNRFQSPYSNNLNRGKGDMDKNQLRVDYLIFLPKNHPLTVQNSFGDIYLPQVQAAVNVRQNYGTFYAEPITNAASVIEVNFGKAIIKSMRGGHLKAKYSELLMDEANNLNLVNDFGTVNIKRLIDVNGAISYSSGEFEEIMRSANLKLNFSNELKIGDINADVRELELNCNFSSVVLPVHQSNEVNFDVRTKNGSVIFPADREVRFSTNSDTQNKKAYYSPNRVYTGTIGNGKAPTTNVIIRSSFGDIKIK